MAPLVIRRLASALLAGVLVVGATPAATSAGTPVPAVTVIQEGLVIPWDVAFDPDGAMYVTERPGYVNVYASGAPGAARLHRLQIPNVRAEHESGANGIAVDVDFANRPYVYVCAARDADGAAGPAPWVNELLRYRVTAQKALVEQTLIAFGTADAQARAYIQHNGCSVEMDASGNLWIGIGDGGVPADAQDPDSLNGKILRITRDGAVPADNPVLPGASAPTAVYSLGHRNPQGIGFDPASGLVYAAEQGPNVNDEINQIQPGRNYGWPCYTGAASPHEPSACGNAPASAFAAPAWASGSVTVATSGMTFLDGPAWEDWDGSPISAQLKDQDLRRFVVSNGGATLSQANLILDGQYGRLRATVSAPDGSLYITTSNGSADRVLRVAPGPVTVDRYAGADRYETAALVSSRTFGSGVPVAYVATGLNYPDALSGGAAAARAGGPVLLVRPNAIPGPTATELRRLAPNRIVVLGGTAAVSTGVQAALEAYDTGGGVSRIAGADRYETAANVSRATFPMNVPVAYVATGAAYPDALAGVPAAGVGGGPILLVGRTSVPRSTDAELARLRPQRIVVLGGAAAISPTVVNYLQRHTPTGVQRLAGADRYETAANVSARTFGVAVEHAFVATGRNFPDGLTGGAAAAFVRGPLLLVPGTSLPPVVAAELERLEPRRVTILGGTGAVSEEVRAQIEALLNR